GAVGRYRGSQVRCRGSGADRAISTRGLAPGLAGGGHEGEQRSDEERGELEVQRPRHAEAMLPTHARTGGSGERAEGPGKHRSQPADLGEVVDDAPGEGGGEDLRAPQQAAVLTVRQVAELD